MHELNYAEFAVNYRNYKTKYNFQVIKLINIIFYTLIVTYVCI